MVLCESSCLEGLECDVYGKGGKIGFKANHSPPKFTLVSKQSSTVWVLFTVFIVSLCILLFPFLLGRILQKLTFREPPLGNRGRGVGGVGWEQPKWTHQQNHASYVETKYRVSHKKLHPLQQANLGWPGDNPCTTCNFFYRFLLRQSRIIHAKIWPGSSHFASNYGYYLRDQSFLPNFWDAP